MLFWRLNEKALSQNAEKLINKLINNQYQFIEFKQENGIIDGMKKLQSVKKVYILLSAASSISF